MTIRRRLALWYGGAFTIIIVVLCLIVIAVSRVAIYNTIDSVLVQTSSRLVQDVEVLSIGEFGTLTNRVVFKSDDWFAIPNVSIQVWQTNDGTHDIEPLIVQTSYDIGNRSLPLTRYLPNNGGILYETVLINGINERVISRPFYDFNGQQLGFVQVAMSIEPIAEMNEVLLGITFVAAIVSIIVSLLISLWMAERMVRPIHDMMRAASNITVADDLSTRITWQGGDDELRRLVDMFNHMMERLEHLFSVQQRFVSNVSHELRTPLTAIMGNIEVMEKYGFDPAFLSAVFSEASRMSRMVSDLLLLARADYGAFQIELIPLDLDYLVIEVFEQVQILAKERDLQINLVKIDFAHIKGNSDRLKQLMLNLVNNAIKFTPDGGTISLALEAKEQAIFTVSDMGIGISEENISQVFDRFYQADNSRVHRSQEDGAGLGLSIVQWIVHAHNAKIDVQSTLGKGTTFRVIFPLLSST